MRNTRYFDTLAEAIAFFDGIMYVGDIDVEASDPELSNNGKYEVTVTVGYDEEED